MQSSLDEIFLEVASSAKSIVCRDEVAGRASLQALDSLLGRANVESIPQLGLAAVLVGLAEGFYNQIKEQCLAGNSSGLSQSYAHSLVDLWGKQLACEGLLNSLVTDHRAGRKDPYFTAQIAALLGSVEALLLEQLSHLARAGTVERNAATFDWSFGHIAKASDTSANGAILAYLHCE